MPEVRFTPHLKRYFPDLGDIHVEADTVAAVVQSVDRRWPGLAAYLVDERGALRKHVNIFVGKDAVRDREGLGDAVPSDGRVFILQALSGG